MQSALPAARSELMGYDYGLDPKKPEDKKKIDQARAIFDKYLNVYSKLISAQLQVVTEMKKQVGQLDNGLSQIFD
jgi:hypothetical protein